MKFYIMVGEGVHPVQSIRAERRLPGGPWYQGKALEIKVPMPVAYKCDPSYPGDLKMLYNNKAYPLIHNSLLEVLKSAGVNNLELFPAQITDEARGEVHRDYQAFNVLGLVSAADLEKSSSIYNTASTEANDRDFESLYLKEGKNFGLQLFRLTENCSTICVSEQVRNAIEERGIPGIIFYDSGEWSG